MIKIEFPADRADIALAIAQALHRIATGDAASDANRIAHAPLGGDLPSLDSSFRYLVTTEDGDTYMSSVDQATIDANAAADRARQLSAVQTTEEELPATINDLGRRDLKGVAFDERYCANAQDPFYSSGKEKGQWKAKRGLAAGVYERWYAEQLAITQLTAPADEDTDPTPIVQTGAAFGAVPSTLAPAPQTAGEFMAWVAEKQTAGKLSQDAINNAYANLGVRVQDLFPPTPEHVVANNVRALHQHLAQAAGA
jgi:hypothetical protein